MKPLIIILATLGIIILLLLIVFYKIKKKINETIAPFAGSMDIFKSMLDYSKSVEDEPMSLGGLESVYLSKIKKDFPNLNINELKEESKKVIRDTFKAIENKDTSDFKNNEIVESIISNIINNYEDKNVNFYSIKIHDTIIGKYENTSKVATICFKSSVGYDKEIDSSDRKHIETIIEVEFIYIVDESKVIKERKMLGLNCPNCGAPIKEIGQKKCNHCGSGFAEIAKRTWVVNSIAKK